jgi:S1-C subfamily serine protease
MRQALLLLLLAGAGIAEEGQTDVPDPYGLGERLALISYLKDHQVEVPNDAPLAQLRDLYRGKASAGHVLSDGSSDADREAADARDRVVRLRELLVRTYHLELKADATEQELIELKHREEARVQEELAKKLDEESAKTAAGDSGGGGTSSGTAEANERQIKEAVVMVVTRQGIGSGFFVDGHGHLVTNYHVAGAAGTHVMVCWDSTTKRKPEEFQVVKAVSARESDVSLLEPVTKTRDDYAHLALREVTTLATPVMAAGFPSGMSIGEALNTHLTDITLTKGSLTAVRRRGEHDEPVWLQFDCSVVQGNSGGPLLEQGSHDVIGIVTAAIKPERLGATGSNLYFAIPASVVRKAFGDDIGK